MSRSSPQSVTVPLSALRPDLDRGWPLGSRWSIPDPGKGPTVEQPEGTVIGFKVRGAAGVRLRARIGLQSGGHSAAGAIRARVVTAGTHRRELWSSLIPVLGGRLVNGPVEVELEEDGEHTLLLCASHVRPLRGSGARLRWEEPRLEIPLPAEAAGDREEARSEAPPRSAPIPATNPGSATDAPFISVLTPVHNPPPRILEEMLQSVRDQRFQNWEMRLVDDGSTDPQVIRILEAARDTDERIHLIRNEKGGGISAATNIALKSAKGEYIALLDHDDVLTEDAFETVAATIAADPTIDMLYTDEEVFDEGQERLALFLKPNWSPDLMCSHMYTCHLGVYRRRLANEAGGFRSEFDGSQDYDFVLRVSELTDRIVHIPQVLYRWRSHKGSVAENVAAKPHAFAAARRAIAEHLDRQGIEADVHFDAMRFWYRVEYPLDQAGRVSLILPVTEVDDESLAALRRAVRAWTRIDDVDWDLVLVGTESVLARHQASLAEVEWHQRLRLVAVDPGLGRASMLNRASLETDAETLVLLDHAVEQLTSHWLRRLQANVAQEGIGAAAAKTLAFDGRVEHAGVVISDGLPVPVQMGADQIEPGPMAILYVRSNFGAVSGTVATSRETLMNLGGFDESFDGLAVTDYCLRAWESGLRIISEAGAVVRRTGRAPAINDLPELAAFAARWRERLPEDPYFGGRARAALTGVGPPR